MGSLTNIARGARGGASPARLTPQAATELAWRALAFLADQPERIERFLSLSGVDPADIRSLAGETSFQLAILDHLAGDEALLLAFAESAGVMPEMVGRARFALGGGDA